MERFYKSHAYSALSLKTHCLPCISRSSVESLPHPPPPPVRTQILKIWTQHRAEILLPSDPVCFLSSPLPPHLSSLLFSPLVIVLLPLWPVCAPYAQFMKLILMFMAHDLWLWGFRLDGNTALPLTSYLWNSAVFCLKPASTVGMNLVYKCRCPVVTVGHTTLAHYCHTLRLFSCM